MYQLVMHEKNSSSRHVTKMGVGGGGVLITRRGDTLSVIWQIRGGAKYTVTPDVYLVPARLLETRE